MMRKSIRVVLRLALVTILSLITAPVHSEPNNISLTVKDGSSNVPGSAISAFISLSYLTSVSSENVSLEMILKSRPSGTEAPLLSIIGKADVPTSKYESKSGTAGAITINLSPIILPSTAGTYVYTVVATFSEFSNLTRTADLSFTLISSDGSTLIDKEAPKVDWQNSGISKTQITYNEEVSAKVRITDNIGTSEVSAYFYANSPLSGPIGASISKQNCQRFSGDPTDGYWICSGLKVAEKLSKDDRYSIGFDARDIAGNWAIGQSVGSVVITSATAPTSLIPTKVIIEAPSVVSLDEEGIAKVQVLAYVQPIDLSYLPPGRSSLDVDLIFKGSGGEGCAQQPKESISTVKEGYKFFILDFRLVNTGICTGTFQFYGDSKFEKTDYPTFKFTVNPQIKNDEISISQVTPSYAEVSTGGQIYIYYWIKKPAGLSNAGLGAGIGEFGVDPGPFGEDYPSVFWTDGLYKGDIENGLYRSTIQIPITAKPGKYRTWVFWKGISGPVYGPDLSILASDSSNPVSIETFKSAVQKYQVYYSDLVMRAVNLKFGDGGYKYSVTRPDPSSEAYKSPTLEQINSYNLILSKWADSEIANLKIENFTKQEEETFSKDYWLNSCKLQSPITASSLKNDDDLLRNIYDRFAKLKASGQPNSQQEIDMLNTQINAIAANLSAWIVKLPVYIKQNLYCSDYSNHLTYANNLYALTKSYAAEIGKLSITPVVSSTYIKLNFLGDNKELTGENLYLNGIDSTGSGPGSIEINAFVLTSNIKLMNGSQSLNYQVSAASITPNTCTIVSPRYFLGGDKPFTKFSLVPLNSGKCSIQFSANVNDRKDLSSAIQTWNTTVNSAVNSNNNGLYTELNDDGFEVEPSATLSVSKLKNGRYEIKVNSNMESEDVEIVASKRGLKSIKFKANTGNTTNIKINTSRNLKGFTLVIKFEGKVLDTFFVK